MKNILRFIVVALAVVGALNWGLIGLLGQDYNLVARLFGTMPMLEKATYVAVGVAGLLLAYFEFDECVCKLK